MSNYSVKLTKCGKCQFSLAHLPGEGGGVCTVPALQPAGSGGRWAWGGRRGAVATGLDAEGVGRGRPSPRDTGRVRWGHFGWD